MTGNSAATGAAGGVFIDDSEFSQTSFYNCIVAGNTPANIVGTYDGTSNLTNGNPLLAPLGNYGGLTKTMPPLPGSPAIDAAATSSFATDQRGFARVLGVASDLGAVEGVFNPAGPGGFTGPQRLPNGTIQFGFTNYSGMLQTVLATTNVTSPLNNWLTLAQRWRPFPARVNSNSATRRQRTLRVGSIVLNRREHGTAYREASPSR